MSGVNMLAKREGLLDTVMKGLQIAQSVYGIRATNAQTNLANQKLEDQQNGTLSDSELLEHSRNYEMVPEETPGAIKVTRHTPEGVGPLWLRVKNEAKNVSVPNAVGADGSTGLAIYDPSMMDPGDSSAGLKGFVKTKSKLDKPLVAAATGGGKVTDPAAAVSTELPPDPKQVNKERNDLANIMLKSGQRTNLGRLQSKINSAEALETLLAAHPDGQIPPQFQTELAMGLANLVSPGQVTQAQIEHLDPQTRGTMIANLMQKLTNKPYEANNPEFIKLFSETIEREKAAAQDQIGREMTKARYAYPNFFKADPKGFFGIIGMKPEQFDSSTESFVYVPKVLGKKGQAPAQEGESGTAYAAAGGSSQTPSAAAHPEADEALRWAQQHVLSPNADTAAKAHEILNRLGAKK